MFIYSVKAGTIRFVGIVCVALAALIALIAFVPAYAGDRTTSGTPVAGTPAGQVPSGGESDDSAVTYRYDKVKTADDAAAFLGQFGWVVDAGSAETVKVTIPAEFDKVFAGYNQLQRAQGLDLSRYKTKQITRYTFTVTNYKDWDGPVYANVLVYRNKVIGGDICSADVNGFVHGFALPAE